MSPAHHAIYGSLGTAVLYPFIGNGALFFFGGAVLIDVDHYLDYVYHSGMRDLGLKGMFRYHSALVELWSLPGFLNVEVFHTVEFLAPLYLASRYWGLPSLEAVFWGMVFHILLDMVFLWRQGIFFKRSYSLVEYFIRKRALGGRGISVSAVYAKALELIKN